MDVVGVDTDPWQVKASSNSDVCKLKDDRVADVMDGQAEFDMLNAGPPCDR